MIVELLVAAFAIMLASLIGTITVWKQLGGLIERNLNFLVSFAAGVFLVLVFTLAQEVLAESATLTIGVFWILAGLISVWLIVKALPQSHLHAEEEDEVRKLDPRRMLIGDAFHNVGDGILLATAFVITPVLGVATAVSIFVHELVQEIAEFFVLRQAGYAPKKALAINFLVSATVLIGAIGGYFVLEQFSKLEVPILGIATGALLALLLQDLLPHSIATARAHKCIGKHIIAAFLGALVLFTVFFLTAESHIHQQELTPSTHTEDHAHPHD